MLPGQSTICRLILHETAACICDAAAAVLPLPSAAAPPTPYCPLQAAIDDEYWRVQRRQLACLPEGPANELLQALLEQRRIAPPQLELFRHSATSVCLSGPAINPAWLAALGSFSALHELRLQRCTKLRDAALQQLVPLAPGLRVLDLQGCTGLSDGAAAALAQLTSLVDLSLAGTGMGEAAVAHIVPALTQLTALDLGDLPLGDSCCAALAGLPQLRRLRLASTAVGDGGMGALEVLPALTSLDVSFTEVHAPPALTTLRQLSMVHCALGAADVSPQEAVWLQIGCTLPHLEELELASTTLLPPNGDRLLRQLVSGAAGSLRRLDLHSSAFGGDLSMLAAASGLTWLNLAGTRVADRDLADLAPLPLRWLSLADTAVGDQGVSQLLAMPLRELNLSNTQAGDSSWPVLAQLPLEKLDLSLSKVTCSSLPEGHASFPVLANLTSLSLLGTAVDDRGCRHLASALPQLRELSLGSKALEALHVVDSSITDPGLLRALPRCPTLRRFLLYGCWLASEAGLQVAAAAAVQAGGELGEVLRDREPVAIPAGSKAGGTGTPAAAPSRPGSGISTAESPAVRRRSSAAGRLTAQVLEHDERLAYSRDELLQLGAATGAPGSAAAQLRASLPPDLRSPGQ
ncbi:hypothetical protein COHA_002148 [Chlorella ohadii]|uniref:Disease resistance R13L4/SHOC-2-like LRR domain-containing protein n=1 Tax=Chlorella ohadii TaxID=2649997 RepID=A0AAD5DY49_9CHLO|nr:hypothetical protein COHA_002148 [Chlorella ohadii]